MKKRKIVEVTWTDAISDYGWKSKINLKPRLPDICKSVGYIEADKPEYITIYQTWSSDCIADRLTIPRSIIKKIRKL